MKCQNVLQCSNVFRVNYCLITVSGNRKFSFLTNINSLQDSEMDFYLYNEKILEAQVFSIIIYMIKGVYWSSIEFYVFRWTPNFKLLILMTEFWKTMVFDYLHVKKNKHTQTQRFILWFWQICCDLWTFLFFRMYAIACSFFQRLSWNLTRKFL